MYIKHNILPIKTYKYNAYYITIMNTRNGSCWHVCMWPARLSLNRISPVTLGARGGPSDDVAGQVDPDGGYILALLVPTQHLPDTNC